MVKDDELWYAVRNLKDLGVRFEVYGGMLCVIAAPDEKATQRARQLKAESEVKIVEMLRSEASIDVSHLEFARRVFGPRAGG